MFIDSSGNLIDSNIEWHRCVSNSVAFLSVGKGVRRRLRVVVKARITHVVFSESGKDAEQRLARTYVISEITLERKSI